MVRVLRAMAGHRTPVSRLDLDERCRRVRSLPGLGRAAAIWPDSDVLSLALESARYVAHTRSGAHAYLAAAPDCVRWRLACHVSCFARMTGKRRRDHRRLPIGVDSHRRHTDLARVRSRADGSAGVFDHPAEGHSTIDALAARTVQFWSQNGAALWNSAQVAAAVGVIGVLVTAIVWFIWSATTRRNHWARLTVRLSLVALLASALVPGIIVGAAHRQAWATLGTAGDLVSSSLAIVVLAHLARFGFLPVALASGWLAVSRGNWRPSARPMVRWGSGAGCERACRHRSRHCRGSGLRLPHSRF